MIEIICNKDDSDKSEENPKDNNTCIRRPKNIKQIGDVSSDKKIYIEDYAFTYINSIAYNSPQEEQAGVLLGELAKEGNERCVFVKGVIKAALGDTSDTGIYFNENIWNKIYSDTEKYFPDLSVVGWFAVMPEVTDERMARLKKLHLDNFAGNMKTLYLVDTVEKEEHFYLYENGTLKRQKGYVCFYERNYEMQEYMLERSEKKSCEDASDDRVIRNIRNVIREKEELKEQRKSGSFMYGVSAFLVVVIIVIGINLMNNYEKMRRLNQSVDNLMNQLEGNERGGQDGDDNGVHDSEASGDISVDGNAIKVNRLSGDVYPLEENSTSDKTERETESDNKAASETTQAISESETDASVSSVKTDSYSMYTVKQGDTLMGICKRYYGTTTKYQEVMQYNGLDDSDMLYIGQQIKLPE
ncbi:MAG: LysM peptidoglycan-binding domain-containing protein [Lachnospira sp.]|uniref:LysM peptidoglycan-binding domain-containing protein n=1 Tax=Lachnospira sp. TaxID=2049031 RepID=UPI0026C98AD1